MPYSRILRQLSPSITLGVNLDAGFGVKEVGVVSINDDRYTTSDLFTAIFGKKRQDGALVCMTPLVGGEKTRGLEQAVYIALNSYLLKAFVWGQKRSARVHFLGDFGRHTAHGRAGFHSAGSGLDEGSS